MNGDLVQAALGQPTKGPGSLPPGRPAWSTRAFCVVAYLMIGLPALIALCFLTGPFQVADEPNHFARSLQLSHGHALPVVTADGKSAGGYIDRSAKTWTDRLDPHDAPTKRLTVGDVVTAPDGAEPGSLVFAPFPNTVIYFPIAHAAPALAISLARRLHAIPAVWFYAARLANALTSAAVCALAIFLFEEASLFALAVCTLPMVLFEQASLSSDALVLGFSVLFAALLARIARGTTLKAWDYAALALTLAYVCVAKFAYLPLALAPPLVALIQRRDKALIARLAGIAILAIALWAAWSFTIRNDVLSGRLDMAGVDVHRQLAQVLHHPLGFVIVFVRTVLRENIHPIGQMVGSRLGALNLHMPKLLVWLSLATLALASVFRPAIAVMRPLSRLTIAVLALGSLAAVLVLLYLQFNPMGQPWIDGFQGRYVLPVLPLLPLVVAGRRPTARWSGRVSLAVPVMSAVGAAVTVLVVAQTYWR